MLVSSIFVVAGLTTPNPVIVRSENLFDRPDVIRGVLRITRNPFFWGVGLFAIAHVIIVGDVAEAIAFGSVAFLGLAGAPILDAKKARMHGASWDAFAADISRKPRVSSYPFSRMMESRPHKSGRARGCTHRTRPDPDPGGKAHDWATDPVSSIAFQLPRTNSRDFKRRVSSTDTSKF
jgi:hypothetical protein